MAIHSEPGREDSIIRGTSAEQSLVESRVKRPARPGYHLHASTYVVLLLTATVLFFVNVPGQYTIYIDPVARSSNFFDYNLDFERIEHGWPCAYLVRKSDFHNIGSATAFRPTRIWSLTEDFQSLHPWSLAADLVVAGAVLCVTAFTYERWRRRRTSVWQFRITELLAITAVIGVSLGYLFSIKRDFEKEAAVVDHASPRGYGMWTGYYQSQGRPMWTGYYQSQGGPSWLRPLCGERFPRWWDRTVVSLRDNDLDDLQYFPQLRVLSIHFLHDGQLGELSALQRMRKLRALQVWCGGLVLIGDATSPRDVAVAHLLAYLRDSKLECLSLGGADVREHTANAIGQLRHLRALNLVASTLDANALEQISTLPNLELLLLSGPLETKAVNDLRRWLPGLKIEVGDELFAADK